MVKVYIVTDLEGVAGVVHSSQVQPGSPFYEEARRLLTGEVNAAVAGALRGGATEVVVNDGHGGGLNLVLEELHEEAKVVLGAPRPFSLGGLSGDFGCVFLIGYHSRAGAERGVLSHTMSSESVYRVTLNGVEVGEIGIVAALAGYFGVPVTLVTGDAAAVEEARRLLGDVKCVVTKWGLGRQFALSLSPKKARRLIERAAEEAVRAAASAKPFKVEPPYELVVEYTRAEYADSKEHLPGVERVGERTVKVRGRDLIQVFKLVGFC
jgi:D-amino peptidase